MAPAPVHSNPHSLSCESNSSAEETGHIQEKAPTQELLEPMRSLDSPGSSSKMQNLQKRSGIRLWKAAVGRWNPRGPHDIDVFHHPDLDRYGAVETAALIE